MAHARWRRCAPCRTQPTSFSAIHGIRCRIRHSAGMFRRGPSFSSGCRRYGKPTFGLDEIEGDGVVDPVLEDVVWSRPFCNLLRFVRPDYPDGDKQPRLLIVGPMSGHYATLLRGTVEAFLPHYDVYITDWTDARMVPLALGSVRSRRLHRLSASDARSSWTWSSYPWRLPAVRALAGGSGADGGARRSQRARQHDPNGRTD